MKRDKPEVLAIIPARGGSKGIPRKNIADLCGNPLIAYTIEVALQSRLISRVVVSTDDEKIAAISKEYCAEVPFLRPQSMAGDDSCVGDCIQYTLRMLKEHERYDPEALITLYPTHPFRTPMLLDTLIHKATTGYKFTKTVKAVSVDPKKIFILNSQKKIVQLHPIGISNKGEEPFFLKPQGTGNVFNIRQRTAPFRTYLHRLQDPISLIDIDTPYDLLLAQEIIKERLFDFKVQ